MVCSYKRSRDSLNFFAERTVASHSYLDMLELFAVPQIGDDSVIFQQSVLLRTVATFPWYWIGKGRWKQ
jgi:hypothetical protein